MVKLDDPIFTDADKARAFLEAQRWPDGPICTHCSSIADATGLAGKAHRPGVYQCNACREQFTVTVGTVFERSKIPLNKWLHATFLMTSSKKGISAQQLGRMLGLTYKTAWFMAHRIRAAMAESNPGPLGGEGKTLEADETYFGKLETPRKRSKYYPRTQRAGVVPLTSARCLALSSAAATFAPFTALPLTKCMTSSTPMLRASQT